MSLGREDGDRDKKRVKGKGGDGVGMEGRGIVDE
jgi:hypothetical protein